MMTLLASHFFMRRRTYVASAATVLK